MTYTPRPGSKTEAAIDLIREKGGFALCTDIRDACDIDLKNIPGTFRAALDSGLLEYVETAEGMGYRLMAGTVAPTETRAETMARELQVSQVIPARKPPPTARSMAKKPKLKTAKELGKKGARARPLSRDRSRHLPSRSGAAALWMARSAWKAWMPI
jgi:hypothetical protein